ncbi:uncharacterized protein LOC129984580 [Argiope bruennichi]|uniref:Major facilitator superfamily (MFS) profile domain-containing protein n=1 Tax=Argiope bruennichi TaxID=94029 RepID=A0A8T0EL25_ARGBR|nr:uncharacterized protein LOC129984580 [Argiope bruennichi]KAF8774670.1 hypothetical protein HNY73_017198 [Argiope bruennichi]
MAFETTVHSNSDLMNIKLKRRFTYGTILMFNLCTGLGYAIIFPTIWNYIHDRLGGQTYMLGIVISAYSLSSFIANPLVGWWSDKSLNTRNILLVTILAEAVGSILYFIGMHIWVLVIGRLIAGIGAGGGAAVLADITRTTSEEDRTPVLSVVIASRQLGLIIGPAFNIFLSEIDFHIFSLPVDKYTSPGLLMAMLWLLLEVMVLFAYYNLTSLKDDEDVERLFQNYNSIITGSIPYSDLDNLSTLEVAFTNSYPPYSGGNPSTMDSLSPGTLIYSSSQPNLQVEWLEDSNDNLNTLRKEEIETINCQAIPADSNKFLQHDKSPLKRVRNVETRAGSVSDRMIESAERLIQSTSGSYEKYLDENSSQEKQDNTNSRISSTNPSTPHSDPFTSDEKTSLLGHMRDDYFRDEIIVLLGLAFISCFAQTVLETIVTPLAQKYYSFDEMDNSYIYLFAGIEIIIVYTAIKYISRVASDRSLIIFGLITLSISMILPMLYIPSAVPGDIKTLAYFIITIVVDLVGIAVITVCSSSLISKLTSEDSQALFQGFRRSMVSLGCIMGPLWGGAFLFNIYFLFSVPLAVIVLITVLFLLSFKKLIVERV